MAVETLFPDAIRTGDSYRVCCPAHDDDRPSLSIRIRDGRALVKCFAGCTNREIANALAITEHELYATLEETTLPGGGSIRKERRR
jgi:hypothetical protein